MFFQSPTIRLLILLAIFFVALMVVSILQSVIALTGFEGRPFLLTMSVIQSVLAFILPACIAARLFEKDWRSYLSLDRTPSMRAVAGVVILFIVALPFLNQMIFYNENVSFPAAMENAFRAMEDQARHITDIMLGDTSVMGLISGILVVGVVTGIAEEMFFRGALQRVFLGMMRRPASAIVLSAFVFSLLHMQFYGFAPRFLMGIMFGYICWKSGSVMTSAVAHMLNNSLVVLTVWLTNRGMISSDIDTLGVIESGFPWIALLSCLATVGMLVIGGDFFFSNKKVLDNKGK